MSVNQLIIELMDQGIDLACDGHRLRVRAPKGTVTPEVKSRLKAEKLQILTVLQATKIRGIPMSELRELTGDDWQEIQNDPGQLEAFTHALKTTRTRQRGEKPDHYTKASECAVCGPVWLWQGAPDKVQGCHKVKIHISLAGLKFQRVNSRLSTPVQALTSTRTERAR